MFIDSIKSLINNLTKDTKKVKLMKKVLVGVLAVCLLLYITNPTKSDFAEFVEEEVRLEMQKTEITGNSQVDNLISLFSGTITKKAANTFITRKDYYLFSIYEVEAVEMNFYFVGIFRKFFPMEKEG